MIVAKPGSTFMWVFPQGVSRERVFGGSAGAAMNNRVVKACLAAGCSVAGPVLAFSASSFGVKALDSSDGVANSGQR